MAPKDPEQAPGDLAEKPEKKEPRRPHRATGRPQTPGAKKRNADRQLAKMKRAERILELRVAGWNNLQIANELGYSSAQKVSTIVGELLATGIAPEKKDQLRRIELSKLDHRDRIAARLMAEAGRDGALDTKKTRLANDIRRDVAQRRARLLGLDEASADAEKLAAAGVGGPVRIEFVVRPEDQDRSPCRPPQAVGSGGERDEGEGE